MIFKVRSVGIPVIMGARECVVDRDIGGRLGIGERPGGCRGVNRGVDWGSFLVLERERLWHRYLALSTGFHFRKVGGRV